METLGLNQKPERFESETRGFDSKILQLQFQSEICLFCHHAHGDRLHLADTWLDFQGEREVQLAMAGSSPMRAISGCKTERLSTTADISSPLSSTIRPFPSRNLPRTMLDQNDLQRLRLRAVRERRNGLHDISEEIQLYDERSRF